MTCPGFPRDPAKCATGSRGGGRHGTSGRWCFMSDPAPFFSAGPGGTGPQELALPEPGHFVEPTIERRVSATTESASSERWRGQSHLPKDGFREVVETVVVVVI